MQPGLEVALVAWRRFPRLLPFRLGHAATVRELLEHFQAARRCITRREPLAFPREWRPRLGRFTGVTWPRGAFAGARLFCSQEERDFTARALWLGAVAASRRTGPFHWGLGLAAYPGLAVMGGLVVELLPCGARWEVDGWPLRPWQWHRLCMGTFPLRGFQLPAAFPASGGAPSGSMRCAVGGPAGPPLWMPRPCWLFGSGVGLRWRDASGGPVPSPGAPESGGPLWRVAGSWVPVWGVGPLTRGPGWSLLQAPPLLGRCSFRVVQQAWPLRGAACGEPALRVTARPGSFTGGGAVRPTHRAATEDAPRAKRVPLF